MRRLISGMALGAASLLLGGCVTGGGAGITPNSLASTSFDPTTPRLLAPLQGGLVGRIDNLPIGREDQIAALEAEYRALESTAPGDTAVWQSQGGLVSGIIVPSQPYRVGSQDCRQYTHTITVVGGGGERAARGAACRNEDGSWELLT